MPPNVRHPPNLLPRHLTWALLGKLAALALIYALFFAAPRAPADVGVHIAGPITQVR